MQSFFLLSGENLELAKDEIVSITKSYDKNVKYATDSKMIFTESELPWQEMAQRATFVKIAGKLVSTFSELFTELDLILLHKSDTFACRAINLSSKTLDLSTIERTIGSMIKKATGTKVSLSNPLLTVYLIFTDLQSYLGYSVRSEKLPRSKKISNYPFELPWKLARTMVNLSSLNENQVVCDPFCGTGTILLEAESMGIRSIGIDFDNKMCEITRKNLAANGYCSKIINSDYEYLIEIDSEFDGIVTDLPYGISSKSSEPPRKLARDFVSILPKKKQIVIMGKKDFLDQIEIKRTKQYNIYRHKNLIRTILVK